MFHDNPFSVNPFPFVYNGHASHNGTPKSQALAELVEAFKPQPTEVEKLKARVSSLESSLQHQISRTIEQVRLVEDMRTERDKARGDMKKVEADLKAKTQAYASCATDRDQKARDYTVKCEQVAKLKKELAEVSRGPFALGSDEIALTNWCGEKVAFVRKALHDAVKAELEKVKREQSSPANIREVQYCRPRLLEVHHLGMKYEANGPERVVIKF
jgi:myosin heavy subunit